MELYEAEKVRNCSAVQYSTLLAHLIFLQTSISFMICFFLELENYYYRSCQINYSDFCCWRIVICLASFLFSFFETPNHLWYFLNATKTKIQERAALLAPSLADGVANQNTENILTASQGHTIGKYMIVICRLTDSLIVFHIIWYDMLWYDMTWYDMIWLTDWLIC